MSWRFLIVLVVLIMAGSAVSGVALGNWLVEQAPRITGDPRTNTAQPLDLNRDASGRPLVKEAPQPLSDGTLGVPRPEGPIPWEVQAVSLFDMALDPMVVLSRGDESFTVSDMLVQAGQGLSQGPADVATIDVTSGAPRSPSTATMVGADSPQRGAVAATQTWQQQLEAAVKACASVGFFSRPSCIERARRKFCDPNQGWGQHPDCPTS